MYYRLCHVPVHLARTFPYYPSYWSYGTNIIGSQVQNADQSILNTGIMANNTQTQTLNQIGNLPFLR